MSYLKFKGERIIYSVYERVLKQKVNPANLKVGLSDSNGSSIDPPAHLEEYFMWKSTGEFRGYKL